MQMFLYGIDETSLDIIKRVAFDHPGSSGNGIDGRNDFNSGAFKEIADLHLFNQLITESNIEGRDFILHWNVGIGFINKLSN